tara:strand:+ start:1450 stop:2208 length:759 start_codon:yes stop_codon:yes gene_type:complete
VSSGDDDVNDAHTPTTPAQPALGSDVMAGARAMFPLMISVLPFGLIAGVVTASLGYSPWIATALSVCIFAGTSQIAAIQLVDDGAPLVVILLTVLFINLRFMMYSAAIAPYFRGARRVVKAAVAYFLTDQAFMIGLAGFEGRATRRRRVAFYLGAAGSLWAGWQVATVVGAVAGASIPPDWGLNFAVPLTFIALLVPAITDRASFAAAVTGGVVATAAHALPWHLGLIVGAVSGIGAGMLTARLLGQRQSAS